MCTCMYVCVHFNHPKYEIQVVSAVRFQQEAKQDSEPSANAFRCMIMHCGANLVSCILPREEMLLGSNRVPTIMEAASS